MLADILPLPIHRAKSNDELEREIARLAAHIHAATCELLLLIAEFDAREGWADWGMRSCAHWLNWKCGISLGAAREQVRVAHCLGVLPATRAALGRGEISYSKVRAMTRIATADNEADLLNIARHATASQLEKVVRQYRHVAEGELVDRANRQHAARYLAYHPDEDGNVIIRGRLPAEVGAVVMKAIEAAMAALPEPDEAFAEDVSAETRDDCTGTRRADALARVAEHFLGGGDAGTPAETYQVVVHQTEAGCELEDGPGVSAETCRRLACDASIVEMTDDGNGNPLRLGQKTRAISPALRRALRARDGGCRFPGCTARRFVDGHHIRHWSDGGETNIDNLVLLCRYHHRLVHEGGYSVHSPGTGHFVFHRTDGSALPASGAPAFGRPHRLPVVIQEPAAWNGERVDYAWILDSLTGAANAPPAVRPA